MLINTPIRTSGGGFTALCKCQMALGMGVNAKGRVTGFIQWVKDAAVAWAWYDAHVKEMHRGLEPRG